MLCYAKLLQSCPTLCDPIDGSPPGSPVAGILDSFRQSPQKLAGGPQVFPLQPATSTLAHK